MLGASGFGAIVTALVTGYFSKRKLGAEATQIITKAAAGVVTNLEAEIARQERMREELAAKHSEERREWQSKIEELAAAHVAERKEWQRVLQLHVSWDAIAIAKMAELGVEMPPTPPLLPAQRFVDEHGHPRGYHGGYDN
jgi:transketolase